MAPAIEAKIQAPYDVLGAKEALVTAAHLNKQATKTGSEGKYEDAIALAAVAQSLSTYAMALNAWARQP